MTWREDLRRVSFAGKQLIGASFRGVPFFVESAEDGGGRRAVVHEFPFRDDPYVEDLGRGARTFRIDGYVIGDNYLEQQETLLTALEADGVGELVHPYRGVKRVACLRHATRNARVDGGMATFSIEFTEAPLQAPVPTETVDVAEQVDASADVAIEAAEAELEESLDIEDLPAFAFESAEAALKAAAAGLDRALSPVIETTQELAEFQGRIVALTAQASSLVRQPAEVLGAFREAITGLSDTIAAAPFAVMNALADTYSESLGAAVDAITATRERELANQVALIAGLRRVLAIEAARIAPLVPYASIEDATAARDRIAEMLEEQAGLADDTAYPAIVDLRSQVLRAVPGGREFARVLTVTRTTPVPSLLLAYQLYGSVDLELDIVARNKIRHPGFIAGDVKALSDG